MKTRGIAKRLMAFVVSLMLTFSAFPTGLVSAEPESPEAAKVTLESNVADYVNKENKTIKLTATVHESITAESVEFVKFYDGETLLQEVATGEEGKYVYQYEPPEGNHNYKAEVKYKDGEEEKTIDSTEIKITADLSEPTLTVNETTPIVSNNEQKITGTVVDNGGSGLPANITYKVGSKSKTAPLNADGKFEISVTGSGTYQITANDKAGNPSETKTVKVVIDKTVPQIDTVTMTSNGNDIADGWAYGDVKVSLSASDKGGSKLSAVYYGKNKLTTEPITETTLTNNGYSNAAKSGSTYSFKVHGENDVRNEYKYYCYAVDKAGNVSACKELTVKIDNSTVKIANLNVTRNTQLEPYISSLEGVSDVLKIPNDIREFIANNTMKVSFELNGIDRSEVEEISAEYEKEVEKTAENPEGKETVKIPVQIDEDGTYSLVVPADPAAESITIPKVTVTVKNKTTEKVSTCDLASFKVWKDKPTVTVNSDLSVSASPGTNSSINSPADVKIAKIFWAKGNVNNAKDLIQGNETISVGDKIQFDENKTVSLCAVDSIGNVSEIAHYSDTKAPEVSFVNEEYAKSIDGKWQTNKVELQLQVDNSAADGEVASPVKLYYNTDSDRTERELDRTDRSFDNVDDTYHFWAVDEAGNKSEKELSITVRVDTQKPQISVKRDPDKEWTNQNVKVTVNVSENKESKSGIKEVFAVKQGTAPQEDGTFKESDKIICDTVENNKKYSCTFTDEQQQTYVFYAVNNAGTSSDGVETTVRIDTETPTFALNKDPESVWHNDDVKVTVSNIELGASGIKEVFAVKKGESPETAEHYTCTKDGDEYTYTFSKDKPQQQDYDFYVLSNSEVYSAPKTIAVNIDTTTPTFELNKDPESKWHNDDVKVTVSNIKLGHSGIKEVFAVKQGESPETAEHYTCTKKDGDEYTYTFSKDKPQQQDYDFYVLSESEVYSAPQPIAVNIDTQQPEITELSSIKADAEYGFGIFAKEKIVIAISASDIDQVDSIKSDEKIASGIKTVTMISESNDHQTVEANSDGKFVFSIPVPATIKDNSFVVNMLYKNIKFKANDNAGNVSEEITLSQLYEVYKAKKTTGDLLVDQEAPELKEISFSQHDYKDDGGNLWYSNVNKVQATSVAEDKDKDKKNSSGIGSSKLFASANHAQEYSVKDKEKAEKSISLTIQPDVKDITTDGKINFTATANDVAGNAAETKKGSVNVDTNAPVITGISVNGRSVIGTNSTYIIPAFSNASNVDVRIDAADNTVERSGASGVKKIYYELYDINEKRIVKTDTLVVAKGSKSVQFKVSANFKGYITTRAIDNVGNISPNATTNRFVVETNAKHNSTSSISVTMPETSKRDVNGRLLYSDDVRITVNVTDTYSGVRKIEYSLNGQWHDLSVSNWNGKDSNIFTGATATFVVSKAAYNRNDNVLNIRITDNAGNTSVLEQSRQVHFSIDTVVPTISVVYDNNDYNKSYTNTQYFKADRTATITIQERNFNESDVKAALTSSTGRTPVISSFVTHPNTSDPDKTTHTATIRFTDDADYTFGLDFTDLAGHNAAHYGEDKFTIDKIAPTTNVTLSSAPKNGKYYNEKQTVTIRVNEHNFDSSLVNINSLQGVVPNPSSLQWTSNGDVHTATFILSADDVYAFNVTVADKARNNADVFNQSQFVIDQTKPDALITEVEQGKAYGVTPDVHPTIQGKDINLSTVTYKITRKQRDGSSTDVTKDFSITSVNDTDGDKKVLSYRGMAFEQKESIDGIYTIEANVTDLAGNNTPISKTFSINRFGANYTIDDKSIIDDVLNKYIKEGRDFKIKAINVTPIQDVEIVVVCNGKEKKLTSSDFKTNLNHEEGGWYEYEYIINKDVFDDDGSYSLRLSASDEAGNTSRSDDDAHNEKVGGISFFIDSIVPSVAITGADDGQSYKEQSKEITVKFEDANIETKDFADYVHILVNGKELNSDEYSAVDAETGVGVVTLRFNVTDTDAEVVAYGVDLAGNESDHEKLTFKLDQNWIQRFYNNQKGLFFTSIGGILAAIAAVVFIIVKKKKG